MQRPRNFRGLCILSSLFSCGYILLSRTPFCTFHVSRFLWLFAVAWVFPYLCLNICDSKRLSDRDTMMPIFNVIEISNLVYQNRRPAVSLKSKVGIDPAFSQILVEWAELTVEVILPTNRSDDALDSDLLNTQEFSVWAFFRCFFREACQFCILAHQFCPE